jgi:hypothetical protein
VVTVSGTPTQLWRQQYFGNVLATGNAADDADPDSDGVSNLMEYALGMNPGTTSVLASRIVSDREDVAGTIYMRFTIAKNPAATDVTFAVQVTSDLANAASWTTAGTAVEANTSTSLIVRDTTPIGSAPRHFMRLRVTSP